MKDIWSPDAPQAVELDPEGLRLAALQLIEASKPGEEVFLALGQRLDQAIQVINRLTGGLTELSSTVDGDEVQAAAVGLRDAAERVVHLVAGLGEQDGTLGELAVMIGLGLAAIEKLHKTISELAILAINAKIEVAQLMAGNADFQVFTDEIAHLAALAAQDMAKLEQGYGQIGQLVERAQTGRSSFNQHHGQALGEVGQRLQQSLKLVDGHHQRSNEALNTIRTHSDRIGGLIAKAVMSLQGNDIIRQRLEHVAQALDKAADLLSGELSDEDQAQVAAIICRLQAIQLVKAAEQFEGDVTVLLGNLGHLVSDADSMVDHGLALGHGGEDGQSPFDRLQDELGRAQELYGHFEQAREDTRALTVSVSEAVTQMMSHVAAVSDIEADIRLMGLNATLRCGRLGQEGRALVVIAQELRLCANRTQEQAQLVTASLRGLVVMAGALSSADGSEAGQGAPSVIDVMSLALERLIAVQRSFDDRLPVMIGAAQETKTLLSEVATQTDFHQLLGKEMRRVSAELEVMAGPRCGSDQDERALAKRALGLLDSHYTMASERDIHDLFLTGSDDEAAKVSAPAPAGTDADLDDIFF